MRHAIYRTRAAIVAALLLACTLLGQAADLTSAQLQTVKTHITGSSDLNSQPNNDDGSFEIARLLNLPSSPVYWAWRTNVREADIYNELNDLTGVPVAENSWNWTTFKTQGAVEVTVWGKMFIAGSANFAKPNIRAGVANIHGASSANTAHALAIGRRTTTRVERLLSTGTGTTASPGLMTFEGTITLAQVQSARTLP